MNTQKKKRHHCGLNPAPIFILLTAPSLLIFKTLLVYETGGNYPVWLGLTIGYFLVVGTLLWRKYRAEAESKEVNGRNE